MTDGSLRDGHLQAECVTIEIAGRCLIRDLAIDVAPGTFTCILGRNGTGKTLALRTLAGLLAPATGVVSIGNRPLHTIDRRELARRRALLTQTTEDPFPSTVLEAVLVGRHPHLGTWQWEGAADHRIARHHLREVGLDGFEDRSLDTLSGGERRRVAIAAVLTQSPDIYLLDEPTNHLDPHHQVDVMQTFRRRADAGHVVLTSLHEPGLAARHADAALLLFGDGQWLYGPAAAMLDEGHLSHLYQTPLRELRWEAGRTFVPV